MWKMGRRAPRRPWQRPAANARAYRPSSARGAPRRAARVGSRRTAEERGVQHGGRRDGGRLAGARGGDQGEPGGAVGVDDASAGRPRALGPAPGGRGLRRRRAPRRADRGRPGRPRPRPEARDGDRRRASGRGELDPRADRGVHDLAPSRAPRPRRRPLGDLPGPPGHRGLRHAASGPRPGARRRGHDRRGDVRHPARLLRRRRRRGGGRPVARRLLPRRARLVARRRLRVAGRAPPAARIPLPPDRRVRRDRHVPGRPRSVRLPRPHVLRLDDPHGIPGGPRRGQRRGGQLQVAAGPPGAHGARPALRGRVGSLLPARTGVLPGRQTSPAGSPGDARRRASRH